MAEIKAPLADRLRPDKLSDVIGQQHLLDENGFITKCIEANKATSIIFWGPPGCGKTTLARLYAQAFKAAFVQISAVFSGVADLKKIVKEAQGLKENGTQTVLFVDEIHRFNKTQQDAFLPYVENGTFILVGATTENPSFELNSALLSRCQVLTLNSLDENDLESLLQRAEKQTEKLPLEEKARHQLISMASGDGRYLLNLVEVVLAAASETKLDVSQLANLLQKRAPLYDKGGDGHYNLISALHKAVRGSDPDAALYWFSRMLNGGEDPLYLARRLIRMAVEDVGLADPQALPQTIAARQAYETLGSPEGELALAQAVIYLSLAPKSNALYAAFKEAGKSAKKTAQENPPMHILNAPTGMMKDMGYGENYAYDHDTEHGFSGQHYFPDNMTRQSYYQPVERGFERDMQKRLAYFNKLRRQLG